MLEIHPTALEVRMSGNSGRTAEETQRELAKALKEAKERAERNGQTGRSR